MNPEERVEYDREVADLHATLDETTLTLSWAEARGLIMEQAVAYATGER